MRTVHLPEVVVFNEGRALGFYLLRFLGQNGPVFRFRCSERFADSVLSFREDSETVFNYSFLTPSKVKMQRFCQVCMWSSVLLPLIVGVSVLEVYFSGFAVSQRPQCQPL